MSRLAAGDRAPARSQRRRQRRRDLRRRCARAAADWPDCAASTRRSTGRRHAYEIDDRPDPAPTARRGPPAGCCDAVGAGGADAGLGEDLGGVPVLVGTGLRELRSAELWWRDGTALTRGRPALRHGAARALRRARTYTFANACSASLYALALATDLLDHRRWPTPSSSPAPTRSPRACSACSTGCRWMPPDGLRPFDVDRRGVAPGRGRRGGGAAPGGARPARHRPARVRAVEHQLRRRPPDRARRAGHRAADAGRRTGGRASRPPTSTWCMLHGTGTPLNDAAEATALAEVFGAGRRRAADDRDQVDDRPHLGRVRAAQPDRRAVVAERPGRIPPTPACEQPIDRGGGVPVRPGAEAAAETVRIAQVDAFGFGGVNAVAVLEAAR